MREKLSRKRVGQRLSASHVNKVTDVARRYSKLGICPNLRVHQSAHIVAINGPAPFTQYIVSVYDAQIDEDDAADSGLYKVRVRYYDHEGEEWKTDEDQEYILDGTEMSMTGLDLGDKVVAFWHSQRGAFVPTAPSAGRHIHGILEDPLTSADDDMIIKFVKAVTGPNPAEDDNEGITVRNPHFWDADGGARVDAVWCSEERRWEAIQITCP